MFWKEVLHLRAAPLLSSRGRGSQAARLGPANPSGHQGSHGRPRAVRPQQSGAHRALPPALPSPAGQGLCAPRVSEPRPAPAGPA